MDEIKNLRYCYQTLRRRILDEEEGYAYWRMKLKVAAYFLKTYDTEFDPASWDYVKELSDSEERGLLKYHPLLQRSSAYGERFRRPSKAFEAELRRKIEKYLARKAKLAVPSSRVHHRPSNRHV